MRKSMKDNNYWLIYKVLNSSVTDSNFILEENEKFEFEVKSSIFDKKRAIIFQ